MAADYQWISKMVRVALVVTGATLTVIDREAQTTMLTIRPGTTMIFFGSRPSNVD